MDSNETGWQMVNGSYTYPKYIFNKSGDLMREPPQDIQSDSNALLYFRCGWCGNPTDANGKCLTVEEVPFGNDENWNSAKMTNGECCPNGDNDECCRAMYPTEDMLKDAGLV